MKSAATVPESAQPPDKPFHDSGGRLGLLDGRGYGTGAVSSFVFGQFLRVLFADTLFELSGDRILKTLDRVAQALRGRLIFGRPENARQMVRERVVSGTARLGFVM